MDQKIDGFIKIYDGTRYLVLLAFKKYDAIYKMTRYLMTERSGIADSVNHNFEGIRIDSFNSLPIEKYIDFHNAIILIKPVVNKNKNEHYYNIYLEKGLYKDKSNTKCC